MGKNIKLSPKHGVNPSVTHCKCCGKEIGIAMFGKLKDDKEAPRDVYMGLCNDCQRVVDQGGVMIIEVRDGEKLPNPYRTGRLVGCTKDFKERMEIKSPIAYMEQSMFSELFDKFLNKTE